MSRTTYAIQYFAILLVVSIGFLSTGPVLGIDTHWQHTPATPGDWFNSSNWSEGVPGTGFAITTNAVNLNGPTSGIRMMSPNGGSGLFEYRGSGTYELSGTTQMKDPNGMHVISLGNVSTHVIQKDSSIVDCSSHDSPGDIEIASWDTATTTYRLSDSAQLMANNLTFDGTGHTAFFQTGGTVSVNDFFSLNGNGTYELSGTGQLNSSHGMSTKIGGDFTQTGGTHKTGLTLSINGTYNMGGGTLTALSCRVRGTEEHPGSLNITDADAVISFTSPDFYPGMEGFILTQHAILSAVPGSTINLNKAFFANQSTHSQAVAGLQNLALVFDGESGDQGEPDFTNFEVAGQDMGPVLEGFEDNFMLGTLQLGNDTTGDITLGDRFDNQPEWTGDEALYVDHLELGDSSSLDLNGYNIYCHTMIDNGATIIPNGGSITIVPIPEPSAWLLLAVGMLGSLLCRSRKRP